MHDDERVDLCGPVAHGKKIVDDKYHPDGYNIGINVGTAAGQSIHHLHSMLFHVTKVMLRTPGAACAVSFPTGNSISSNPIWQGAQDESQIRCRTI